MLNTRTLVMIGAAVLATQTSFAAYHGFYVTAQPPQPSGS